MLTAEAKLLHDLGLKPNHISGAGILLAFLAGCTYWVGRDNSISLILAPMLLLISGLFDALDGVIARTYGETTAFGGFLDSLLDRYADSFVFVGIIVSGIVNIHWGLAALVGSLIVSYVRARAEATGVKLEAIGLAERAERIIIITLASFFSFFWIEAFNWGLIILAVLTNLTVLHRTFYFYREVKQRC
ncbi:MAG: CDP-alcohol phosphatidyltransferase family protein [Candidatus Bathyarchaeota archaeon]|nr:MAG: CDP-alcohol phosphatidyltransferase family protein [Candidatus Bathyarchaeota archaeon]